jgi:hypothetical protein
MMKEQNANHKTHDRRIGGDMIDFIAIPRGFYAATADSAVCAIRKILANRVTIAI